MGAVVDARDNKLGRSVAMKVMLHREADKAERHRFLQEARVLSQLAHPNIVPVYDLGADAQGRLYYTMKLVQGVTLNDVIEKLKAGDRETLAKYPLNNLLTIFQKACDAVAFAHSRGIIHRDLKPQNIMVGVFGEVLVMDWGLAKILPGSPAEEEAANALAFQEQLSQSGLTDALPAEGVPPARGKAADIAAFSETVADHGLNLRVAEEMPASSCAGGPAELTTNAAVPAQTSAVGIGATLDGSVVGTPHYMSPEQAQGRVNELDARADIYSLGGTLYTLLTLRPPVEGKTLEEVLEKVRTGTITPPSTVVAPGGKTHRHSQGAVLDAAKVKPLPHIPGGRVPAALSAVVMKALRLDKTQRYQNVAALTADVAAYQGGFATAAEEAGALTQLRLLLRRHRAVTAALALLLLLSLGFVLKVVSSEREARRLKGIAQANEQQAIAEKEAARQSLAQTALALAEAALREGDGPAMQAALQQVPADLRDATWSYLLAQADTSIARVRTGATEIQGVAAHPRRPGVFAVADTNRRITLLEVRTGKRLLEFRPAVKKVDLALRLATPLAFSPDGERIAVGHAGASGGIAIHSARDGKRLSGWDAPATQRLEFSPDGRWLLQTHRNQAWLKLWDAATGQLRWTYEPGERHVYGAFTSGGQVLTHSSRDKLRLVQAQDGALVRQISQEWFDSLVIRPDGKMAVAMLHRGGIQGLSLQDGSTLFEIHPPLFDFRSATGELGRLAFTPDGQRVVGVVAPVDGRQVVQLWDANTGAPLQSLLGGSGRVNDACVHPLSGELLVSGAHARAWDLIGTPAKWTLPTRQGSSVVFWGSEDVIFAPAYVPGKGDQFQLQALQTNGAALLWKPPTEDLHLASTSPDGRFAVIGPRRLRNAEDRHDFFFLRQPGSQVEQVTVAKPYSFIEQLRLSPAGDRWAAIQKHHAEAAVYARDPGTPSARLDLKAMNWFWDLGWLGPQRLVGLTTAKAARGSPGSEEWVVLWDGATGKIVQTATNRTPVDVLAVAPDGRRFAEAGEDKKVRIRDAATLAVLQEFRAHNDRITALAWHPQQPVLATASEDLCVKLWNLDTGRLHRELRGPTTRPASLAFSPSGARLCCVSRNDAVRIWETE